MSHFQLLERKLPGPKFHSFDQILLQKPIVSQLWMPYDTIEVMEDWFRSKKAHDRKLCETKIRIFKTLSHFQIWKFLNGNLTDLIMIDFCPAEVWDQIKLLEVEIPEKIEKSYCPNLCPILSFWRQKLPGPKFHSFDQILLKKPISQSTINVKWHNWGRSLISTRGSPQQKRLTKRKVVFWKSCIPLSTDATRLTSLFTLTRASGLTIIGLQPIKTRAEWDSSTV